MAGSLNHIVDGDGTFTMNHIENLGDAHEALEECHQIIAELLDGDLDRLEAACHALGYPIPALPVLQPERWGTNATRELS